MSKARINVKPGANKLVTYELEYDGKVVGTLSALEVIDLASQSVDALRFTTGDKLVR